MINYQGQVLNHYEYDAFGEYEVKEEQVANRFGFTREQFDPATNLYYLRARFYNPVIARFIQEDSYYGDGLNLYAYCHNNPVNYVDSTGHKHGRRLKPYDPRKNKYPPRTDKAYQECTKVANANKVEHTKGG